jgi:hypothetical protein
MLVSSGKTNTLEGLPWAAIELTSEARIEEVVHHIINWLRRSLRGQAFQLLFPVKSRTVETITMLTPHLWVRSQNLKSLAAVKAVMGVQGLVSDAHGRFIVVQDEFVQKLIAAALEVRTSWSGGIEEGSFVRVLLGSHRMLCGTVERVETGAAEVLIALRSKNVLVRIPVGALQNLGEEIKAYFYKES